MIFRTGMVLGLLGMLSTPAFAALSFEETARQVIIAFQQKDNAKINALIDKKTGLYVMYRIGSGYDHQWMSHFDINQPIPDFYYQMGRVGWFSEHIPTDKEFDYRTEVHYVCDKGWDHAGFFVSYTGFANTLLTFSMANETLAGGDQASNTRIANARRLELLSKRVVAVPTKSGDGLIFHLSELHGLNKGWSLTLLDLVTEDCSA
ncbi:hypothetical protein ACMYSL_09925 [Klebsiella sp. MISC125]|uniref:hypothetical protein n=1 Tax=Klebsiella sp. MISC125 TaxID=2755386 RepID=UPI003DA922FC